jgi:hypothetical protein
MYLVQATPLVISRTYVVVSMVKHSWSDWLRISTPTAGLSSNFVAGANRGFAPSGLWPKKEEVVKRELVAAHARYRPYEDQLDQHFKYFAPDIVVGMMWDRLSELLCECVRAGTSSATELRSHSKTPRAKRLRGGDMSLAIWHEASSTICSMLPDTRDLMGDTGDAMVVDEVNLCCMCALGVEIDRGLLLDVIAPLWVGGYVAPSKMVAHTIVRSSIMHELIGVTLGDALLEYMHADHFGIHAGCSDQDRFVSELKHEVVSIKQELTALKAKALCMCGR